MHPADATAHVLDLAVPAGLTVGYIAAEIDPIPDLLRSLDIRVDLLDETALAFGNLARYDAIIVGTRAYELRADVVRANPRLLEYVRQGGTLVVQYERPGTWERLHPWPFPASMSSDIARTTDENSPVRFVAPANPVLNFPNKITMDDFKGWVQERGLYYWTEFDSTLPGDPGAARSWRKRGVGQPGLRARRQGSLHFHRVIIFPRTACRRSGSVSPVREFDQPVKSPALTRLWLASQS